MSKARYSVYKQTMYCSTKQNWIPTRLYESTVFNI